jgi:hypothetical protein
MSLQNWVDNRWLNEHETNREEITGILSAAMRDMSECKVKGLSADWRMNIAYSSVI